MNILYGVFTGVYIFAVAASYHALLGFFRTVRTTQSIKPQYSWTRKDMLWFDYGPKYYPWLSLGSKWKRLGVYFLALVLLGMVRSVLLWVTYPQYPGMLWGLFSDDTVITIHTYGIGVLIVIPALYFGLLRHPWVLESKRPNSANPNHQRCGPGLPGRTRRTLPESAIFVPIIRMWFVHAPTRAIIARHE